MRAVKQAMAKKRAINLCRIDQCRKLFIIAIYSMTRLASPKRRELTYNRDPFAAL